METVERAWRLGNGHGKVFSTGCEGLTVLSMVHHVDKIQDRKQRTDIGKYSFANRTIKNWNQLHAEALGTFTCKTTISRKKGKQL